MARRALLLAFPLAADCMGPWNPAWSSLDSAGLDGDDTAVDSGDDTAAPPFASVSGSLDDDTTWTRETTWILDGLVYVEAGATLTVEAGTTVLGSTDPPWSWRRAPSSTPLESPTRPRSSPAAGPKGSGRAATGEGWCSWGTPR